MSAWRVALIAVAGCGGDPADVAGRAAPLSAAAPSLAAAPSGILAGRPRPPRAPRAPRAPRSVDVTMAPRTPFTIVRVARLDPAGGGRPAAGGFDVAYTVKPHIGAPAQPEVRARVTCRIHELSLAVEPPPEEFHRASGETRLSTYFRPDPFTAEPGDCEISFQHRGASVGKACLRAGGISDGGCGADAAPLAVTGVAMTEAELAVRDGTVSASAVLTVGATRTGHAARVRCEDGARVAAARGASPLAALDGMAPGTSRYVQLTAELAARIGSARSRCEVALTAGGGAVLARYCVAGRRAEAGACAPALGAR